MAKVIRNSIFTVIALLLTAVGLSWNQKVARQANPVEISQSVLSVASSQESQEFPLSVELGRTHVKLGQYQTIGVHTEPRAELEIVTIYPNGSVNNPQTLRAVADETGSYNLKFKLDDFAFLGVFQTKVVARAGGLEAKDEVRFALQTWVQDNASLDSDGYVYPLVP